MSRGRLVLGWLRSRLGVLCYIGVMAAAIVVVYGLYGYPWGVAGYALLLAGAAGAVFVVVDFSRFAAKNLTLKKLAGRFPTGELPVPANLTEENYAAVIEALEAERTRLAAVEEDQKRDAGEYYTLWVHQIKTPIAAMRLQLQSGKPRPAALEQELFRIEQYVEMVLQYQRLSSFSGDLQLEAVSVERMVKRAAKQCATLFIYRDLPLKLGELPGRVVTDEKWFVFVLEQLLSNAVKYTKKGAVSVYMDGAHTLVVEDTGIGIAAEDLPRVFERGFTGAVGRSERSSTGLGLHLCREILTKLGLGIALESEAGKGTRVKLDLRQHVLEQD